MSIAQMKSDLRTIVERLATDPPSSPAGVVLFLQDSLLPWLESLTEEVNEMDESIEDLVHGSADVLHGESAGILAAPIAAGLAIAAELSTRVGNDARLLKLIKEYRELARQGSELLAEITLPDDEDDDEEEEDADNELEDERKPAAVRQEGTPE